MKYSRISNDTSHLKHYIKLVAGGVDKDCQGVKDLGDKEEVIDGDLVQVITHKNLWVFRNQVIITKTRQVGEPA